MLTWCKHRRAREAKPLLNVVLTGFLTYLAKSATRAELRALHEAGALASAEYDPLQPFGEPFVPYGRAAISDRE